MIHFSLMRSEEGHAAAAWTPRQPSHAFGPRFPPWRQRHSRRRRPGTQRGAERSPAGALLAANCLHQGCSLHSGAAAALRKQHPAHVWSRSRLTALFMQIFILDPSSQHPPARPCIVHWQPATRRLGESRPATKHGRLAHSQPPGPCFMHTRCRAPDQPVQGAPGACGPTPSWSGSCRWGALAGVLALS